MTPRPPTTRADPRIGPCACCATKTNPPPSITRPYGALIAGSAVCKGIVQPLAAVCGDGQLYRHLHRSVLDTATMSRDRTRRAGFAQVRSLPMTGRQAGVVHTVVGRRPILDGEEKP